MCSARGHQPNLETMKTHSTLRCLVPASIVSIVSASTLGAAVLTLNLDAVMDGSPTPPQGSSPWISVTFTDLGTNSVRADFTATDLTGSEFVSEWFFNLDPTLDPSLLTFAPITPVTGAFALPTVFAGVDAYKANGGGFYDFKLVFATSGGSSNRFTAGDVLSYQLSHNTGIIDAMSFDFDDVDPIGVLNRSAAHVQGIGPESLDSAWIAELPEPSTALHAMIVIGAWALGWRHRKHAKSA
jgi:hypothetical protein